MERSIFCRDIEEYNSPKRIIFERFSWNSAALSEYWMLKEESNILIYLERRKFRRKREKTENSDYLKKKNNKWFWFNSIPRTSDVGQFTDIDSHLSYRHNYCAVI